MNTRIGKLELTIAILVSMVITGCAFRVPRIDPQGRSIFLPQPNYTQISLAEAGVGENLNCIPEPAWTTPPDPAECRDIQPVEPSGAALAQPTCGPRCGMGCGPNCIARLRDRHLGPGENGELQMTPRRLVARVGSEIVLRSGVCDPEGCLVTGEPIEWILTQDSVGHLVELGGTGRPLMSKVMGTKPRKVTDRFAVTHTSTKAHLITRGTPSPADDVPIRKGEGWVSVTSPREGVSYVTAIAPKTVAWKKRRDTAIIHWIDAKWELPSPASVRTTNAHELITRLTTSEGEPREGWTVRYELESGPEAEFVPGRSNIVEVTTDNLGEARVNVEPLTDRAGISRVKVEIIRPGDRFLEQQVVGRGWTTVRWSAPALRVEVLGPAQAEYDRPVQYLIRVQNIGDLPAAGVVVSTLGVPRALEFLNSSLAPARELTDGQEWNIGDLAAGQARTIEANFRIAGADDAEVILRARARDREDTIRAEGERRTAIFVPSLRLEVLGPDEAEVGQEVQYEIRMTNTGRQPLENVRIQDSYDPGLRQIENAPSPIFRDLGRPIAPGQTEAIGLTFVPTRPGYFCHTVTVQADGGQQASERACLTVRAPPVAPQRDLRVRLIGPDQGRVDTNDTNVPDTNDVLFRAEVANTGNVPLTNVIVEFDADAGLLSSKEATTEPMFRLNPPNRIRWTLDTIGAGDTKLFEVRYNCERATRKTDVNVLVTADDDVRQSATRSIEILPERQAPAPPVQPGPAQPQPGRLDVSVFDLDDPIPVNGETVLTVQITNDRDQFDGAVRLFVTIPEGLDLVGVLPGAPAPERRFDQRVLEFQPVVSIRGKEALRPFRIRVKALAPGDKVIDVEVRSNLEPNGVTASEQLTVTAR